MFDVIKNKRFQFGCLILSFVCICAFLFIGNRFEINYLDQEYLDQRVFFILENMSVLQVSIHLWVTMTLDVIFPLAYGFLFFGILLNNLEDQWKFLAILPLILIAADLAEGIFQIQLLKAETTKMMIVSYKNNITLIKYFLFLICMGICLLASMLKLGGSGKT